MSKDTCLAFAEVSVDGKTETSRLHMELMNKKKGLGYPRPLANLIYACYISDDLASKMEKVMDSNGKPKYKKNRQGQFNAKDVADFLDIEKHIEDINNLSDEEFRYGFTESLSGKRTMFSNAEEVLNKVSNFNDNHKGLVAIVSPSYSSGDVSYTVMVREKTADTVALGDDTVQRLKAWNIYKHVFADKANVDLSQLPSELGSTFSAYNKDLYNYLTALVNTKRENLTKKDILALFSLDAKSNEVERLVLSFGSIDNAVEALDDFNHGNKHITDPQNTLLTRAVNHAQKILHDIGLTALEKQIKDTVGDVEKNSHDHTLSETLKSLNTKYGIDIKEINDVNEKINSLADANRKALIQLSRRIKEIRKSVGRSEEGEKLKELYDKINNEIQSKHYYKGIIEYLELAGKEIASIDKILENIPQTGTEFERVTQTASALQRIKQIREQYFYILSAIDSDSLVIDEDINQIDVDNIKERAKELRDYLLKKDGVIDSITENTMRNFMRMATNHKIKESELNDLMEKALKDVSWQDRFLYSIGTQNNIVISAAGSVIQSQYVKRSEKLHFYRALLDKADNKLRKAGFNSEFMYEDQNHIVSDIDWKAYEDAKEVARKNLIKKGFKDFALSSKMGVWIMENTTERVVDRQSGRKERVPNDQYRKAEDFQKGWSPAQKEYYDTVLELKGQLETLYPEFARNLYLPPQVRRNTADALFHAKGLKDVGKALGNKAKDLYTIWEDDTEYNSNAIVQGDEVAYASGNYDNTVKKHVPIFFQKTVEEGELMKDFSSALLHEASSATNYEAMTEIEDILSLVRDFADSKAGAPNMDTVEEISKNRFQHTVKSLYKWGRKNNVGMVLNSFMEAHLYGQKRNPDEAKWMSKLVDKVVGYTSFKGLATNVPGAFANALTGVQQIFIEAGCGEFFGRMDLLKAVSKLFGDTGVKGEVWELLSNNTNSKGKLLWDFFDPSQDNYQKDSNKRYHSSAFRKLVSKDLSFIGYGVGEYFIHLLPMYAILYHEKVKLNGKTVPLYEVFDVSPKTDGNSELTIKNGATDLDGNPLTFNSLENIKSKIRYANKTMHGAMNVEDKGLIHQYCLGRLAMNFRQWMVEHVARRFRGRHFDYALSDWREGYWVSLYKGLFNEDTKETWEMGMKKDAVWMFMKDFISFMFRSSTQWSNLSDMQKYNIKRARTEILTLIALGCLSMALGEPDEHKKEFWRRFFIYQTKRMITDTEGYMPVPQALSSALTIMNSPMAGVSTVNSILYILFGFFNGDLWETIQSGEYKGWNKYGRNVMKYTLPFFKDYEHMRTLDKDDSIFKVFDTSPSKH